MNHRIELDRVGHHFSAGQSKITLFKELSLTLNAGRSYAIVGPSGAGKSSLLMLIAGLEEPKQGKIHFSDGLQFMTKQQLRKKSGFIFQQFHLLPELDALGNLALPLRLQGDKQAYEKAQYWLEKIGLSDRSKHRPNQLSGGEQQRIAIARAFVSEPKFIFADEPTGNLDEITSSFISDLMFDISAEQKCALVMVTHSQTLAARAENLYHLSQGMLEVRR